MKINFIKIIIAIGISMLLAYGFYCFKETNGKLILCIGSFIFLAITLIFTIGINFQFPRTTTNVRSISSLFFVIAFLINLLFSFITFSIPIYVIIVGLAILTHALIVYSVSRA